MQPNFNLNIQILIVAVFSYKIFQSRIKIAAINLAAEDNSFFDFIYFGKQTTKYKIIIRGIKVLTSSHYEFF